MTQDTDRDEPLAFDAEIGDLSAEEAAEAAELARLAAGKSGVSLSGDAMEGIGLLVLARADELSPEAFARIEAEVLSGKRPQTEDTPVTWRRAWWWLLAAVAPAATALFLTLNETSSQEAASVAAVALPDPNVEVLEAQASWVTSDSERLVFERELHAYRAQVLAALDTR